MKTSTALIKENKHFILDKPYKRNYYYYAKKTVYFFLALLYKTRLTLYKPNFNKDKKYNVSICAIFKDEAEFLKEWIEFHLIVGVDHFYMYNNNSTDNFLKVLTPYINEGRITLIDWSKNQAQIEAYEDCINQFRGETKWLGFIDLDEFVVPCSNNTIYDFLKQFNNNRPAVLIYWKIFGSSSILKREQSKLVTEQFILAWPKLNDMGKCFFNTSYAYADREKKNSMLHHVFWSRYKKKLLCPVNIHDNVSFSTFHHLKNREIPIQINHYVTKSYQDYYNKTNYKSDVYFKLNPRNLERFYLIDSMCTEPDYKIYKYMVKLKQALF